MQETIRFISELQVLALNILSHFVLLTLQYNNHYNHFLLKFLYGDVKTGQFKQFWHNIEKGKDKTKNIVLAC